jgi:hypothetical protein
MLTGTIVATGVVQQPLASMAYELVVDVVLIEAESLSRCGAISGPECRRLRAYCGTAG